MTTLGGAQTCIVHIHFKQKTHDTLRTAISWKEADQDLKPAFSPDLLFKGSPKGRVFIDPPLSVFLQDPGADKH